MATNHQAVRLPALTRWAAVAGIALLVARRSLYAAFPDLLPSNRWPVGSWAAGTAGNAVFELFVFAILLAVPAGIYYFRLRSGNTTARELLVDCAAAVSLYLAALFLL